MFTGSHLETAASQVQEGKHFLYYCDFSILGIAFSCVPEDNKYIHPTPSPCLTIFYLLESISYLKKT